MRILIVLVMELLLFPDVYEAEIRTINEVSGTMGESLTIHCGYPKGLVGNKHYWCKQTQWGSCSNAVKSKGKTVKKGRVSIKDNRSQSMFTVMITSLTQGDAVQYWCGTKTFGYDDRQQVKVTVFPSDIDQHRRRSFEKMGQQTSSPASSISMSVLPFTGQRAINSTAVIITASDLAWSVHEEVNLTALPFRTNTDHSDANTSSSASRILLQSLVSAGLLFIMICAAVIILVIKRIRQKSLQRGSVQGDLGLSLPNPSLQDVFVEPYYQTVGIPVTVDRTPLYSMIERVPAPAIPDSYVEIQSLYTKASGNTNPIIGLQAISAQKKEYNEKHSTAVDAEYSTLMGPQLGSSNAMTNNNINMTHRATFSLALGDPQGECHVRLSDPSFVEHRTVEEY